MSSDYQTLMSHFLLWKVANSPVGKFTCWYFSVGSSGCLAAPPLPPQMNDTYNVNVTGPLMLTKALLPLMKVAAETRKKEGKADLKPLVVNMGSYLGSVHNNDGRG